MKTNQYIYNYIEITLKKKLASLDENFENASIFFTCKQKLAFSGKCKLSPTPEFMLKTSVSIVIKFIAVFEALKVIIFL